MIDQSSEFTYERIRSDVAELLAAPVSVIRAEDNLIDMGLDSIRIMTLVERWRSAGVDVNFMDLTPSPCLTAWWDVLSSAQKLDANPGV